MIGLCRIIVGEAVFLLFAQNFSAFDLIEACHHGERLVVGWFGFDKAGEFAVVIEGVFSFDDDF